MAIENVQRRFTRQIDGVGLMSYRERLNQLGITTLLERRARGDLIETFKILSGIADYGKHFFKLSHNRANLVIPEGINTPSKYDFISRRVVKFWNKLHVTVKASTTVESFKVNLERYKMKNLDKPGNYWELSEEIFNRINEDNRQSHVNYMITHSRVAKALGINIH